MGFEISPWKEGDEDRFEVFVITSDSKWTPRRYLDVPPDLNDPCYRDTFVASQDNVIFQDALQDTPLELVSDGSSEIPHVVKPLEDDDTIPSIDSPDIS
jgi:hypothetical protein